MFNYTIQRSSSAIVAINCQLVEGFVLVTFKSGKTYSYKNVSKRAIIALWLDYAFTNENISLGFWVKNNCILPNRVRYANVTGLVNYYGSPENFFASV
jgi:hypothetical protein